MEDQFSLTYIQGRKVNCLKNTLPVANLSFRSKSDDILVQKSWIVAGSLYVIADGKYFLRTFTGKVLSRGRCKRVFKPFVLHRSCAGGNQICVEEGLSGSLALISVLDNYAANRKWRCR